MTEARVRVHFKFSDGGYLSVWLPEYDHQWMIANVLAANPVATYRITKPGKTKP